MAHANTKCVVSSSPLQPSIHMLSCRLVTFIDSKCYYPPRSIFVPTRAWKPMYMTKMTKMTKVAI